MPESIQALRERHAARAKDLHNLVDNTESEKWTPEHQEKYDALMSEVDELKASIKRHEDVAAAMADQYEADQVADAADRVAHDSKSREAELFAKWARGGDNALSAEEWTEIRATMSTGTGSEGGYSVQSDVASRLVDFLNEFGGVREAAEVITTEMGNDLSFPTSDGTSETGELIGENTTATGDDPDFGTVPVNAYKFSSKIVAVPFELIQDSQIDVEAFVGKRCTQRIHRVTNTYFTTGTGSSQPGGIQAKSTAGKAGATGQATSVIYDSLIDLFHSVNSAYRKSPGAGFMMNDLSVATVRKIKDDQGRPIFLPGYEGMSGEMPDMLMGKKIVVNDDMPVMAANAKSLLFGDLSKYVIRDVMAAQLFRFADSAYIKLGQIGFLMWMRSGGNLTDTSAVKYFQNSAT